MPCERKALRHVRRINSGLGSWPRVLASFLDASQPFLPGVQHGGADGRSKVALHIDATRVGRYVRVTEVEEAIHADVEHFMH